MPLLSHSDLCFEHDFFSMEQHKNFEERGKKSFLTYSHQRVRENRKLFYLLSICKSCYCHVMTEIRTKCFPLLRQKTFHMYTTHTNYMKRRGVMSIWEWCLEFRLSLTYTCTHTHKYSNMKSINTHKALHNIITILWELTELNGAHYTVTIEMRFSSTRNINFSEKTTPMLSFLTTTSNLAKAILRKHLICKYF